MSKDYLWDGSGEPDPEIQKLESALESFRHNRPAPQFPERVRLLDRLRVAFGWPRLAAAAAIILLVTLSWLALRWQRFSQTGSQVGRIVPPTTRQAALGWDVAQVEGSPTVGAAHLTRSGRLPVGEWLETDQSSSAEISVSQIGKVSVEPNSRLRLVEARAEVHRLALERGTIHALIWAPPGRFFVDTPSAIAHDLGCAYTLHVDASGAGLLRTTMGWVGFSHDGRESFVPAGAVCATRPGVGPGTPYYEDASTAFREALEKLDFEKIGPEIETAELQIVLARSRRPDAFSLWHLVSRPGGIDRGRVYDRLAVLVPPPAGVTREGVMKGDRYMLDLWWDQLGLGSTALWRKWEQSWPPEKK